MVVLSKDLKDLPPAERIKKLKQIEEERKKELAKKKKELEKKAEEEEEQHKKDLEEAEELIKKSIEDLREEEEKTFEEIEKARKEKEQELQEGPSLEEMIEGQEVKTQEKADIYGKILEEIKQDANFYEVTDYNVFHAVQNLAQKSIYENLSFQEQESLRNLKKNLERIDNDSYYSQKDSSNSNYLQKINQTISNIESNMQRFSEHQKKKDDKRKDDSLYQTNQSQR